MFTKKQCLLFPFMSAYLWLNEEKRKDSWVFRCHVKQHGEGCLTAC